MDRKKCTNVHVKDMACIDHNINIGSGIPSYIYRSTAEAMYLGLVGYVVARFGFWMKEKLDYATAKSEEYDLYCKGVNWRRWTTITNDFCHNTNVQIENTYNNINKVMAAIFSFFLQRVYAFIQSGEKEETIKNKIWKLFEAREIQVCMIAKALQATASSLCTRKTETDQPSIDDSLKF